MKPEALFYIPVPNDDEAVAGPYDLVQMAKLLRDKMITAETLTFREGEEQWKAFGQRSEFIIAQEMPADAVSMRLEKLKMQAEESGSALPLPSAASMIKLGGIALLLLVVGTGVYFVSAADTTTGFFLAVVGGTAALVGQVFILVKLLDEEWITRLMVAFVPLFDIYYFISNLDKYLPFFCAKYLGGILALAAYAGIASVDSSLADRMKAVLSMLRLSP